MWVSRIYTPVKEPDIPSVKQRDKELKGLTKVEASRNSLLGKLVASCLLDLLALFGCTPGDG